jgi:hypothetical protein
MITQEHLKSLLDYDQSTGVFTWKSKDQKHLTWNKRYSGTQAGTLKADSGYIIISINKKPYRAHRLAWLYTYGEMPTNQLDHINGIRNDNRLINLRDTQQGENHKNKRLLTTNKTGYHGITLHPSGKYRVKAWSKNVQYNLGYYKKLEDAVIVRKQFEATNGYHPNHGLVAA